MRRRRARALQARWTEHAKSHPLAGRDERTLWERFRAACNAVFRGARQPAQGGRQPQREQRRAFEELCEQAERLSNGEGEDDEVRRQLRELQQSGGTPRPPNRCRRRWTRASAPPAAPWKLRSARAGAARRPLSGRRCWRRRRCARKPTPR